MRPMLGSLSSRRVRILTYELNSKLLLYRNPMNLFRVRVTYVRRPFISLSACGPCIQCIGMLSRLSIRLIIV